MVRYTVGTMGQKGDECFIEGGIIEGESITYVTWIIFSNGKMCANSKAVSLKSCVVNTLSPARLRVLIDCPISHGFLWHIQVNGTINTLQMGHMFLM